MQFDLILAMWLLGSEHRKVTMGPALHDRYIFALTYVAWPQMLNLACVSLERFDERVVNDGYHNLSKT